MTENETELRKEVFEELLETGLFDCNSQIEAAFLHQTTERIMTLITSDKQRLLQELMEEAENYVLVDASPTETEIIGSERAVPIEVIQNKLEGLS